MKVSFICSLFFWVSSSSVDIWLVEISRLKIWNIIMQFCDVWELFPQIADINLLYQNTVYWYTVAYNKAPPLPLPQIFIGPFTCKHKIHPVILPRYIPLTNVLEWILSIQTFRGLINLKLINANLITTTKTVYQFFERAFYIPVIIPLGNISPSVYSDFLKSLTEMYNRSA